METMNIHIRNDVISIRVYEDGSGYHNKDKYEGIVTGYALTDTEIYLTGAHGVAGKGVIKQIFKKLKDLGYKKAVMSRHKKRHTHIL